MNKDRSTNLFALAQIYRFQQATSHKEYRPKVCTAVVFPLNGTLAPILSPLHATTEPQQNHLCDDTSRQHRLNHSNVSDALQ